MGFFERLVSVIRSLNKYDFEVIIVNDGRCYKINETYVNTLKHLLVPKGSLSPRQLKVAIDNNERIGRKAELRIVQYEIERLSNNPFLLSKIEHVSERRVNAGYDILSFDYDSNVGVQSVLGDIRSKKIVNACIS